MYRIRPATQADEPFLFDMLYEALYVPTGHQPLPRSVLDRAEVSHYAAGFGTQTGDVGFVAETLSEPIGAAWVRLLAADPGYGYVDDETPELTLAVRPQWRGRSVGTGLLAALVRVVPRVSLSSDIRNPAIALYERFGFVALSHDGDSVTMLRTQPTNHASGGS